MMIIYVKVLFYIVTKAVIIVTFTTYCHKNH